MTKKPMQVGKTMTPYIAIEGAKAVQQAVKDWKKSFTEGADQRSDDSKVISHLSLSVWGHFGHWEKRMINTFGMQCEKPGRDAIVEINPPNQGMRRALQGVLAQDATGNRWILHKGRMSVPGKAILADEFSQLSKLEPVTVQFSDSSEELCYPVASLESSPRDLQRAIAAYVAICHRVRDLALFGQQVADTNSAVMDAEKSFPELQGDYVIEAQDAKKAERRHADVWHALVAELDKLSVKHSNARVGRWGPDLRTIAGKSVLFEIKVDAIAGEIQQAVGQLFLYEDLLKAKYDKVAVLPDGSTDALIARLKRLNISVLPFHRKGRKITFHPELLQNLFSTP